MLKIFSSEKEKSMRDAILLIIKRKFSVFGSVSKWSTIFGKMFGKSLKTAISYY